MEQGNIESVDIKPVAGICVRDLRFELERRLPQRFVFKEETRFQTACLKWIFRRRNERQSRIKVEVDNPRECARLLPTIEFVPCRNKGQLSAKISERRARQTLDRGLAVVSFAAFRSDEQMTRSRHAVLKMRVMRQFDVFGS